MSKKLYLVEFDDSGLHSLSVADPTKKLENGNLKIVKMLIGTYADEIYEHLTVCPNCGADMRGKDLNLYEDNE